MILDEIAAKTKERIARCKEQISFEEMKAKALAIVEKETENGTKPYTVFPFRDNLAKPGISRLRKNMKPPVHPPYPC